MRLQAATSFGDMVGPRLLGQAPRFERSAIAATTEPYGSRTPRRGPRPRDQPRPPTWGNRAGHVGHVGRISRGGRIRGNGVR